MKICQVGNWQTLVFINLKGHLLITLIIKSIMYSYAICKNLTLTITTSVTMINQKDPDQ